jgi:hypothetical protein
MCTEFFLACLYFVIIFVINFFLAKLLNAYVKNIFRLQKIKNIIKIYPNNIFFKTLYKYSNKEFRNSITLSNLLNDKGKTIDPVILGNIYSYLALNTEKDAKSGQFNDYYFQLLASEYTSVENKLK